MSLKYLVYLEGRCYSFFFLYFPVEPLLKYFVHPKCSVQLRLNAECHGVQCRGRPVEKICTIQNWGLGVKRIGAPHRGSDEQEVKGCKRSFVVFAKISRLKWQHNWGWRKSVMQWLIPFPGQRRSTLCLANPQSLDTGVAAVNSHHRCSLPGRECSQMDILKGKF